MLIDELTAEHPQTRKTEVIIPELITRLPRDKYTPFCVNSPANILNFVLV